MHETVGTVTAMSPASEYYRFRGVRTNLLKDYMIKFNDSIYQDDQVHQNSHETDEANRHVRSGSAGNQSILRHGDNGNMIPTSFI